MQPNSIISQTVAPEDLQPGMFVGVLSITYEFPPFFCQPSSLDDGHEPLRMNFLPGTEQVQPYQVVSVCLPFVFVKTPQRDYLTLDVRRHRLAHLSHKFGRKVFKMMRRNKKSPSIDPAAGSTD